MQQADQVLSRPAPAGSSNKCADGIGGMSRRSALFAAMAAPVALAVPAAAAVAPAWEAIDWIERWQQLGCGVHIRFGNVELTPRMGDAAQNARCAAMLSELNSAARLSAVTEIAERAMAHLRDARDPAVAAFERLCNIDAEYDGDEAKEAAWLARYRAAERTMRAVRPTTPHGLAVKLDWAATLNWDAQQAGVLADVASALRGMAA